MLTLIYTSGTTGPPKGVEITHAQMLAELTATNTLMPTGIGDRAISYLPMAHVAQRFGTHYTGMFTGMQATAVADPKDLPGALLDVRPTFFGAVPRVWEKLKAGIELLVAHEPDQAKRQAMQQAVETGHQYVRATQADHVPAELAEAYRRADEQVLSKIRAALGLDQVRIAVSGAAPIAPKVLEFMLALGIQVAEVWGMSEASCIADRQSARCDPDRHGRQGNPRRRAEAGRRRRVADARPDRDEGLPQRTGENRRGHRSRRVAAYRRHRHYR